MAKLIGSIAFAVAFCLGYVCHISFTPDHGAECIGQIKDGMSVAEADEILKKYGYREVAGEVGGGEVWYVYQHEQDPRKIFLATPFRGQTGISYKEIQKREGVLQRVLRWLDIQ